MIRKSITILLLIISLSLKSFSQGHYTGSGFNPNDYFVPPTPGWVFSLYYAYANLDFYNQKGDKSESIQVSQNPPVTIDIGQKVKTTSVIPMFLHFGKGKILKANWGVLVLPLINSPSANIALDFYAGQDTSGKANINIKSFGFGDLYLQPVWLTWEKKKLSTTFTYGLWVPVGKYKPNDPENVGLGYWSHNIRLISRYKIKPNIGVTFGGTYEFNSKQKSVNFKEAPHFTIDMGSSYNFTKGHEIGFFAHGTWQTGEDKGDKVSEFNDRIYGAGVYGAYWFIPGKFSILGRFVQNFGVRNRFGGPSFQVGLNYLVF